MIHRSANCQLPSSRRLGFLRLGILSLILGLTLQPLLSTANAPKGYWTYTVTDLGDLGGGSSSANAINSSGQIVGRSTLANGAQHAFLYSGGQIRDLGTLPGDTRSEALAINDTAQVVGKSFNSDSDHAFIYTGGQMRDLGGLGGDSVALGIDKSGIAVGYSYDSYGLQNGVLYYGGHVSQTPLWGVFGINDVLQTVGYSLSNTDVWLYNAWTRQTQDIGGLTQSGKYNPTAINNSGQVVGFTLIGGNELAFLDSRGSWQDLGTIGIATSQALAINDSGQVVGFSMLSNGDSHAFGYSPYGWVTSGHTGIAYIGPTMIDLNLLLPAGSDLILAGATGINSSGQIVGWGRHGRFGADRAFLLTPVFHPYPLGLGK